MNRDWMLTLLAVSPPYLLVAAIVGVALIRKRGARATDDANR